MERVAATSNTLTSLCNEGRPLIAATVRNVDADLSIPTRFEARDLPPIFAGMTVSATWNRQALLNVLSCERTIGIRQGG
jgi:hypothetical protein